nr:hypothetical protein [Tanacetum cinerariifolium]
TKLVMSHGSLSNVSEVSCRERVAFAIVNGGLDYSWKYLALKVQIKAYKACLESVKARLDVYKKNEVVFEKDIKILKLDIMFRDNALTELRKKFEKAEKERDDFKLTLEKFENSSKNLSKLLYSQICDKFKTGVWFDSQVFDNQMNDRYKTGEGHHAFLPPYTGNFMPPKPDLILADVDEYVLSEFITNVPDVATSEAKTSETKPKPSKSVSEDISNEVRESPNAPLVKELVSNDKLEKKTVFPTVAKIEFVRPKQQEKPVRKPVKERVVNGNNYTRVNYYYSTKKAHPSAHRNMAPRAVLMKTDLRPLNTARPNSTVDNAVRANQVNAVKALACWVWRPTKLNNASINLKRHNYVDARDRSKSMMAWGTCPISLTLRNLMEDMLPLGNEPKEEKLQKDCLLFDSSSKNASNDEPQPYSDAGKKDDEGVSKESGIDDQKKAKTDREKKRTTRHEFMVPQPRLPTQSPIADEATSTCVDVRYEGTTTTVTSLEVEQSSGNIDKTPTMPHDSPLPRVNTLGSDEGSMTQQKLKVFCTTLSKKVESLKTDLKQTKQIYGAAYTKLIKKVKKLEKTAKSSQARRRASEIC